MPLALKNRVAHARRLGRSFVRSPRRGIQETREDFDERLEDIFRRREHPAPESPEALPSPAWEEQVHELLGGPWPCAEVSEHRLIWEDIQALLTQGGLATGRRAYDCWDDGDWALARAVWCATRHLRPRRVVETGVARGITSRTILEGLRRNGEGHLWSIDLPSRHADLAKEVGFVVPVELRDRWTLIAGSSRHRLRSLLARVGQIDLFVHDSLHSERNMRFELGRAWPVLRRGGAMIVDDVHMNAGFHTWLQGVADAHSVVCVPDDEQALFAVVIKRHQG